MCNKWRTQMGTSTDSTRRGVTACLVRDVSGTRSGLKFKRGNLQETFFFLDISTLIYIYIYM